MSIDLIEGDTVDMIGGPAAGKRGIVTRIETDGEEISVIEIKRENTNTHYELLPHEEDGFNYIEKVE